MHTDTDRPSSEEAHTQQIIGGRTRMGRVWNSWSILHTFMFLFFFLHDHTGCNARMWRMTAAEMEEEEEVAEVVHASAYSLVNYRRRLQTGSYCMAIANADQTQLQTALDWACGSGTGLGNVDCSPLQVGGSCYTPNTLEAHASYAFNAYYVSQNGATGSCNFNGLATPTSTNQSSGTCTYATMTGTTTPTSPTTPTTPSSNSTSTTPTTTTPTPPSSNGTFENNTTTGTTSSSIPSSISRPWLHALCGGILLILFLKL